MRLEVGKTYVTRDGRKVSVASIDSSIAKMSDGGYLYEVNGKSYKDGTETDYDIVSIYTEGPVREVTRREIVPGTYGRVVVDRVLGNEFVIHLLEHHQPMTAEELREAAHILNQIAEAMEDAH